jgi:hypothetical protein
MGTRQNAGTHGDRAHGTGITTINTGGTRQDATTNNSCFNFMEQVADGIFVRRTSSPVHRAATASARIALMAWLRVCLTVML